MMTFQIHRMRGFTLVELMVSLTLALAIMVFLSNLYFHSRMSSSLNEDEARLQEDGHYALDVIGRNLMQAGFGNMQNGNTSDFPPAAGFKGLTGLRGCTHGFVLPLEVPSQSQSSAKPDCAASGPSAAFTTAYTSEPVFDPLSGAGADCSGAQVTNGVVINNFYVDGQTLYCRGGVASSRQPLLSNVDHMQVMYGIDTGNVHAPMQLTEESAVVADTTIPNGNNKVGWERVLTATVCLEMHGVHAVTGNPQQYAKCDGSVVTAADHFLHVTMKRVFTLRNQATASLIN